MNIEKEIRAISWHTLAVVPQEDLLKARAEDRQLIQEYTALSDRQINSIASKVTAFAGDELNLLGMSRSDKLQVQIFLAQSWHYDNAEAQGAREQALGTIVRSLRSCNPDVTFGRVEKSVINFIARVKFDGEAGAINRFRPIEGEAAQVNLI